MKKLYSKKLGGEAFALDAAQLDTLKKAGYTVPSPEEVIADAAAVKIEPPEGKRAYVVFDFKTGAFKVRTRTQTLAESEVGGFVGEVVSAAILCGFVERADMDKPKADAPATPTTASPLVNMLRDAFLRAANNKTAPAADKPAEAADAPEVVISTHAPLAGRDSKSVQITMHIFAITDKFQMLLHRMPPVRAFCSFLMQENHADFGCEPPK